MKTLAEIRELTKEARAELHKQQLLDLEKKREEVAKTHEEAMNKYFAIDQQRISQAVEIAAREGKEHTAIALSANEGFVALSLKTWLDNQGFRSAYQYNRKEYLMTIQWK